MRGYRAYAVFVMTVVLCGTIATPASAAPTTWSVMPNPSGSPSSLWRVSCATRRSCVAIVGTVTELWDGTVWKIGPSPNVANFSLQDISCAAATSCVAVGGYSNPANHTSRTLVANWNGHAWTVTPSPTPANDGYLTEVSCATTRSCIARGDYVDPADPENGTPIRFVEAWDGTAWKIVPISDPGRSVNHIGGLSCATVRSCVLVGAYFTSDTSQTLVQIWDGSTWTTVPSPSPREENFLHSVSCVSARSCVAVGAYWGNGTFNLSRTLVETWDGSTWTLVPSPNPRGFEGELDSVSCTTRSSCVAVGFAESEKTLTLYRSLIEAWDGTAWTIVPSPSPGATENFLNSVSCPTERSCVAVGEYSSDTAATYQTLVLTNRRRRA
jgi:hypothetical protein